MTNPQLADKSSEVKKNHQLSNKPHVPDPPPQVHDKPSQVSKNNLGHLANQVIDKPTINQPLVIVAESVPLWL